MTLPVASRPWLNWEWTPIESFIKIDLNIKLDPDSSICPLHLHAPPCPNGRQCLYRHVMPSPLNFPAVPLAQQTLASGRPRERSTVCKHYLRGLCKKGDVCEFLHELDMRRMPECWWYNRYGLCVNGDDCMYLHIPYPHHEKDERLLELERLKECHAYTRGFCPDGPRCLRRHVRRKACLPYLAGFCPQGPECPLAHPPFEMSKEFDHDTLITRPLAGGPEGDKFGGRPRRDEAMAGSLGTAVGQRRPFSDVTCNKCGEMGHYANVCPQRR